MQKPKDMNELTEIVAQEIENVQKDPRRKAQAETIINAAGKIAAIAKAQCMYAYMKGEEPDIPFMGKTTGKPLKPNAKLISS
jgi:hypothetical protein